VLRYSVLGGVSCFGGASTDADWVDVLKADEKEAKVAISPNTTKSPRTAMVYFATRTGKSAVLSIEQPPGVIE
jgi:hypothetical protein